MRCDVRHALWAVPSTIGGRPRPPAPRGGGGGYLSPYGNEKIVGDPRVHQILEGTNEIMRVIVARGLTEALG